jgi:hypothetical protein
LDDSRFLGKYDYSAAHDSGAIFVGAGTRDTRERASFSNFGGRVDTHAEGDWKVVTTGYGDLFNGNGTDEAYTGTFAGTSSASAIVAATVTAMSSALWFRFGSFYNPRELRDVLRRDGTAQVFGLGGRIGNRPDMRKQVSHMVGRHLSIRSSDFDGDGRKDVAVWRPETGMWYIRYSRTGATEGIQWGAHDDIPVPADVEGDSRAELIVWRPSNGTFYVRRWDGSSYPQQWGTLGDIPVPLDFDGDGKAQLAVMRPAAVGGTAENHWYILSQNRSTSTDWVLGGTHDIPLVGDLDGDHRDDLIVFRGEIGTWLVAFAQGGTQQFQFGGWGDVPLLYHTGGRDWAALWRPEGGQFFINHPLAANPFPWGGPGDIPRMADTDGDGADELAVFRPSDGFWHFRNGSSFQWGAPADIPAAR